MALVATMDEHVPMLERLNDASGSIASFIGTAAKLSQVQASYDPRIFVNIGGLSGPGADKALAGTEYEIAFDAGELEVPNDDAVWLLHR